VADTGGTANPMTDTELKALTAFMDGGGGVFATGDHADLGVELNGRVPRVRSMRKWYFPNPGPNGEPVAPPAIGTTRIETTQRGAGESFTHFDDQSDDIPQPITPRWYVSSASRFVLAIHPHPLLCGLNGPIQVAPDHMHEGEVITPWDLTASFTFAGQKFVEYPADSNGYQWPPQIVGWGQVVAETNTSTEWTHVGDPTDVASPRTFGVVGAYDGHRVDIGRVAVDSTWHHFFDINLIGDPVAPYPKTLGFTASPSGKAALSDIETYYRNIAFWIARPGCLWRLFPAIAWASLKSQPLNMIVNARHKYSYPDMLRLGSLAFENMCRFLPPCTIVVILWEYLVEGPVRVIPPDPWAQPQPGDPPYVDPVAILEATLGASVIGLERERLAIEKMPPAKAVEAITNAVKNGVAQGLRELGADMGKYAEGLERIARSWTSKEQRK
jgi:hypothetical protein